MYYTFQRTDKMSIVGKIKEKLNRYKNWRAMNRDKYNRGEPYEVLGITFQNPNVKPPRKRYDFNEPALPEELRGDIEDTPVSYEDDGRWLLSANPEDEIRLGHGFREGRENHPDAWIFDKYHLTN
jgi:hypothetical protein